MLSTNTLLCVMAALCAPLVLGYDEKFDKMDVDKIIANDELFHGYLDCLLDKGPCTQEHAEEFKSLLPEVISTACAKCTPLQKAHVRKSVKALQEKTPDKFLEFKKKYDPANEHEAKFAAFLITTD